MVATFITDICTAIALSVLFTKFDIYTLLFYVVSLAVLVMAYYKSDLFFENPKIFKFHISSLNNKGVKCV